MSNLIRIAVFLSASVIYAPFGHALDFPGPDPGSPEVRIEDNLLILSNAMISCTWNIAEEKLTPVSVTAQLTGQTIDLKTAEVFRLVLDDGGTINASALRITAPPSSENLKAEPDSARASHRQSGRQVTVRLSAKDGTLGVEWRAILRDGSNAVRQEISFLAMKETIPVQEIQLIEIPAQNAEVVGSVNGSPIVAGNLFFCYERPHCESRVEERESGRTLILSHPVATTGQDQAFQPGQVVAQSYAIGVVPDGQLRRGFLYYLERERAYPFRPFLHYNSWYDICWAGIKTNEKECLRVIELFGRELIRKRGVRLESFVWDDGWDDPKSLWRVVEENFPNGFSKMLASAREYDSALGVWMSPFGGYGKAKEDRLAYGREQGFEIGEQGFLLGKPNYYARYRETCVDMIETNGVNFFKFDGLARGFTETEAMIRLIQDLRSHKPDLFVSITTGTWPSPFWLWSGDSTWRGGHDMSRHGDGPPREQWITYRDMQTYHGVVLLAPLYPLNSLMTQGFAHARHGLASEIGDSAKEIRNELRSFFASGTCLQELYVSPDMMSPQNWDDLAETAEWNHANADVLVDTHWIGGDPDIAEPYGWASWSKRKGILALRNPGTKAATVSLDIGEAFELPSGAPRRYELKSPWKSDANMPALSIRAGAPHTFELEPFQVVVYNAMPLD